MLPTPLPALCCGGADSTGMRANAPAGVYWDKHGGCQRGAWQGGVLNGAGTYEQPGFRLDATFTLNVPDGPATFTVVATRALALPARCAAAAAHARGAQGPVLRGAGAYAIPPGAAAPPMLDEEGNPVEEAPDSRPRMPAPPHYEGLTFASAAASPAAADAPAYPPAGCAVPPCVRAPTFSMAAGVTAP
jgi:hypothetical protein